jgi:hypothetical protein
MGGKYSQLVAVPREAGSPAAAAVKYPAVGVVASPKKAQGRRKQARAAFGGRLT